MLTKSLRIYLCWTKAIKGGSCVYVRNCFIEPGEGETTQNRAARIVEIASDILRKDKEAKIVICGDFNK
jgi:hypothetical protein